ncbi:MAG: hypothetical protein V2I27_02110 [Erythrobacter sp.]|nr:hypothetical protein [Erythrobacter sp.]
MASSSDWIAALGSGAPRRASVPAWIAAEGALRAFSEVSPFGRAGEVEPAPPSPPAPKDPAPAPAPEPEAPGSSEAERAFEQGYAEGHAKGFSEAQAAAEAEMVHLRDLRLAFRTLDACALEALSADLAKSVLALCGPVLREHAIDPAALAARCHAAAARLGNAPGGFTLHLNPLDIAALGEGALAGLEVRPDPAVERGGLRLAGTDSALHDGPEEWLRAIAAALGADPFQPIP